MNTSPLSPDKYLRMNDGRIVKAIEELPLALQSMDDEAYNSHIDDSHNAFADWILDAYGDKALQDMISSRQWSRDQLASFLRNYLGGEAGGKQPDEFDRKFQQVRARFPETKPQPDEQKKDIESEKKGFEEMLDKRKQILSDLRKKGAETYMADLLMMQFKAGIRAFGLTGDEKDRDKVVLASAELDHEIEQIKNEIPRTGLSQEEDKDENTQGN